MITQILGGNFAVALIMRHASTTSSRLSTDKQLLSIPAMFLAQALPG
jgi:hypothetical protein